MTDTFRDMALNGATRMAQQTAFGSAKRLPKLLAQVGEMYDAEIAEGASRSEAQKIVLSKVYATLEPHFVNPNYESQFGIYK